MPIEFVDPATPVDGAMPGSPIAAAFSKLVRGQMGNIPTAAERATADLRTAQTRKVQQENDAPQQLDDVFAKVYNAQPQMGDDGKQMPVNTDALLQQNMPALVHALGNAGKISDIGKVFRAFAANAPGVNTDMRGKKPSTVDMAMLGAGDAFGSTIGGSREGTAAAMQRAVSVANIGAATSRANNFDSNATSRDNNVLNNATSRDNNVLNNETSRANNVLNNETSLANTASRNATYRANNADGITAGQKIRLTKINDLQRLYGVDEATAVSAVDGSIKIIVDPTTRNAYRVNVATGVSELLRSPADEPMPEAPASATQPVDLSAINFNMFGGGVGGGVAGRVLSQGANVLMGSSDKVDPALADMQTLRSLNNKLASIESLRFSPDGRGDAATTARNLQNYPSADYDVLQNPENAVKQAQYTPATAKAFYEDKLREMQVLRASSAQQLTRPDLSANERGKFKAMVNEIDSVMSVVKPPASAGVPVAPAAAAPMAPTPQSNQELLKAATTVQNLPPMTKTSWKGAAEGTLFMGDKGLVFEIKNGVPVMKRP